MFQSCILANSLFVLVITERGVLSSPPVIVDLSVSPFSVITFCCRHLEALLLGAYTFRMAVLSWWPFLSFVRTVKGLRFYPPCKLTSYPATVLWVLTEDTGSQVNVTGLYWPLKQLPQFQHVHYCLEPHFPLDDAKGTRWHLYMQWVASQQRIPEIRAPKSHNGQQTFLTFDPKGDIILILLEWKQTSPLLRREGPFLFPALLTVQHPWKDTPDPRQSLPLLTRCWQC